MKGPVVRSWKMGKFENEKAEIWSRSLRSELISKISEIWVWYLRLELIWGIWAEIRARDLRFEMWYVEKWENEWKGEYEAEIWDQSLRSELNIWDLSWSEMSELRSWENGKMGKWENRARFSHFPIFPFSHFSNGKMGKWENRARFSHFLIFPFFQ